MKYFMLMFSTLAFFSMNAVFAQKNETLVNTEPVNQAARAENFVITLVKDIVHINDTTHKHHHEAHKSSFKIVHINFDVIAKEGTKAIKGNKTVMIKLIDAHGEEEFDPVAGGGYFMVAGKESPYTVRQTFAYDGKKQHIEILYSNHRRFTKGLHLIEIYMDGAKIGEEHFIIK